jgi:hypothetical protein
MGRAILIKPQLKPVFLREGLKGKPEFSKRGPYSVHKSHIIPLVEKIAGRVSRPDIQFSAKKNQMIFYQLTFSGYPNSGKEIH